jgi:hypothetical protein
MGSIDCFREKLQMEYAVELSALHLLAFLFDV